MDRSEQEMVLFWRKTAKLVDAGLPLLRALRTVHSETVDEWLRQVVDDTAADIENGMTLGESLKGRPRLFPASLTSIVEAGEMMGTLEQALAKIADGVEDGTFTFGQSESTASEGQEEAGDAQTEPYPVKHVREILLEAFQSRASDIHIQSEDDGLRVRYRVDGVLQDIESKRVPKEKAGSIISRIKIMADMNVAEKKLPQDGRIHLDLSGKKLDVRVCVVPYVSGESVVMRLLDRAALLVSLDHQGFTEGQLATVKGWCHQPNGLVVVTGPTGCGKTTTLYSMLQEVNSPGIKITTVEQPVEYRMPGVNQQQVNPAIGLTFASALRSHLRQDPDVLMIGEIRDLETLQCCVQAALTGHLVLTTLHASDAPGAIRRLLDVGLEPFLVNNTLAGVMAQRLLRKVCQNCKEEYEPETWVKESLKIHGDIKVFRGTGCEKCNQTGYRGRIAAHEILELDAGIREAVARDVGALELRVKALESGMTSLRDDGMAKALRGITTLEEVTRVCGR